MDANQQGDLLTVAARERGRPVEKGGYLWRGELRLWDSEALIGWYRAIDVATRSKGSMYFALHPQGLDLKGRWVGQSYDGDLRDGFALWARTDERLHELIDRIHQENP